MHFKFLNKLTYILINEKNTNLVYDVVFLNKNISIIDYHSQ
jgi:hypothetical protein